MFTVRGSDTLTKALIESIGLHERKRALDAARTFLKPSDAGGNAPPSDELGVLTAPTYGHWKWDILRSALSATVENNVVVLNDEQPELLELYSYWRAANYASPETSDAALCLLVAHDEKSGAELVRAAARAFQRALALTKAEEGILEDCPADDEDADDELDWVSGGSDSSEQESDDDDDDEGDEGDEGESASEREAEPAEESSQLVLVRGNTIITQYDRELIAGYNGSDAHAALALAKTIQSLQATVSKSLQKRTDALETALDAIPDSEQQLNPEEAATAARAFAAALAPNAEREPLLVAALAESLEHDPEELFDTISNAVCEARDECATIDVMLDPTQAPLAKQEAIERLALGHIVSQSTKLEAYIDAYQRASERTPTDAIAYALRDLRARRVSLARQQAHTAATIDRLVAAQLPTLTNSAELLGITQDWDECLSTVSPDTLAEMAKTVNTAWRRAVHPVHPDKVHQADADAQAKATAAYRRFDSAKTVLLARIAELQHAFDREPAVPLRARAAKRKARELELERERLDACE